MKLLCLILSSIISFEIIAAPLCVGHRGNNAEALENSIDSLLSAKEVGAEGIEFDVRHDKLGEAFLMHDETLERVVKKDKGCPLETDVSELDYNSFSKSCSLLNGQKIPSLHEAIVALRDYTGVVVVEFKDVPNLNTLKILNLLGETYGLEYRVISFSRKAIKYVQKFKYIFPYLEELKLLDLAFVPGVQHVFSKAGINTSYWAYRSMKYTGIFRNKEVGVWTIDKEKQMRYLLSKDIAFLTTNKPRLCLKLKRENTH